MTNSRKKNSIISILLFFVLTLTLIGCVDKEEKKYTVEDLDTKYTDELKLETPFENQRFLTKGIEEVTLLSSVDGDTAHFLDKDKETIKIRFLGVNTPESTGKIAPWGKQASIFTKNKLVGAYSIVIEAEKIGVSPEADTTGTRYLGYVWYKTTENDEYRLLNLEIIENCFSFFTGDSENLKYGEPMRDAYIEKSATKLRVFGTKDPNYDYDTTIIEITIGELKNNYSDYTTGTKLKVTARVIRTVGNAAYVEDLDASFNEETGKTEKAGIFVYHSFNANLGKYAYGQVISFECQASDDEVYGKQLVNPSKLRSIDSSKEYTIREIDNSITSLKEYEGLVVKVNNFTITRLSNVAETGAYTIYGTMENGAELLIRVDADATPKLALSYLVVGEVYDVIGGVSRYLNPFEDNKIYYQIKLGNINEEGLYDFKKVNNN